MRSFARPALALTLALFVLTACGDDDAPVDADLGPVDMTTRRDEGPPDLGPQTYADELGFFGSYPVGFRELEVTYERPDGEGERTIPYVVWYPAAAAGEIHPRHPFRRGEVSSPDAEPATGPFPTLAFSHGHQAVAEATTNLCEHLASHGWVVLSPTHVGNTTVDGPRSADIYYLRPHDVSEALTGLQADPTIGPLVGTPMAVAGHSFGGYTAFALAGATFDVDTIVANCEGGADDEICTDFDETAADLLRGGFRDERFEAVVSMGAGDYRRFGAGAADVEVPVLLMVAEGDGYPAGSAPSDDYWNAFSNDDDLWIDFLGADHNTFTDVCVQFPGFLRCPEAGTYDDVHGVYLTRLHALAFLRSRLLGDADATALLAGTPVDPSLEIVHR